jgi:hypothetical protein
MHSFAKDNDIAKFLFDCYPFSLNFPLLLACLIIGKLRVIIKLCVMQDNI